MSDNQYSVLVVDDEEDLRESIVFSLKYEGFKVLQTTSGNSAFEMIKNDPKIAVVISDIRMSDGDGFELLKKVKAYNIEGPKIFLITGYAEFSEDNIIQQGADGLLKKPFDIPHMLELVSNALEEAIKSA